MQMLKASLVFETKAAKNTKKHKQRKQVKFFVKKTVILMKKVSKRPLQSE